MLRRSLSPRAKGTLPPFPLNPKPYTGPSYDTVLRDRTDYVNPAIFKHFKEPLMIVEGKMQYMFDHQGKRYLDCFGGIVTVSVGHCHPRVTKVIQEQADTLVHSTTLYLNPNLTSFAKELASTLPGDPKEWQIYFTSSGSEANDLACLMARTYTKRTTMVSLRNGYHGMSEGTRNLTAVRKWNHATMRPAGYVKTLCPDEFRAGVSKEQAVRDLKEVIDMEVGDQNVAGFIAERYQGVGGAVALADGYLKEAYAVVRASGGVCISDEVQCGFGRLGTHFWGFEEQGVVPDIISMAKSIGNGIPLAAVAAKRDIAHSIKDVLHFNTYGGNPLSMAVGREVLKIIKEDKLQAHCDEIGNKTLIPGLRKLQEKYPLIGEVRGKGLMIGVDFVTDRATKSPATEACNDMHNRLKTEWNIIMGKGGAWGNVFRIKPPMCITHADVEYLLEAMDAVLAAQR